MTLRAPLATAVIGGILSSTILGLVVLPILLRLLIGARPASGE